MAYNEEIETRIMKDISASESVTFFLVNGIASSAENRFITLIERS